MGYMGYIIWSRLSMGYVVLYNLTKLDGYNAIWEIQLHVFHCQYFGHKVNTTTFTLFNQ